jgi:hypothetical protein
VSDPNADAKKRNNRNNRPTPTSTPSARRGVTPDVPAIQPSGASNQGGSQDCPFNNLPPDQRPHNWPFDNC